MKKPALVAGALLAAAALVVMLMRALGGSTGAAPAAGAPRPRYRESPILRERVERGELPPVDQRLPEQPLVVPPIEGIGRYDSDPVRPPTGKP